ncbi:hypothetical protein TYRP_023468 [Tyrophagus putrescentiae]|nr:hypothetical protein TYRP_023468 [Tyrophagus putrescentiae]
MKKISMKLKHKADKTVKSVEKLEKVKSRSLESKFSLLFSSSREKYLPHQLIEPMVENKDKDKDEPESQKSQYMPSKHHWSIGGLQLVYLLVVGCYLLIALTFAHLEDVYTLNLAADDCHHNHYT